MQCGKCGQGIEEDQGYEHRGKLYCEGCYMNILSPPKSCDPWAVYSAKGALKGKDKFSALTAQQLRIVNYLRGKGEAIIEDIVAELSLTEDVFQREFAVLRHMEILKAKKTEGKVLYVLF